MNKQELRRQAEQIFNTESMSPEAQRAAMLQLLEPLGGKEALVDSYFQYHEVSEQIHNIASKPEEQITPQVRQEWDKLDAQRASIAEFINSYWNNQPDFILMTEQEQEREIPSQNEYQPASRFCFTFADGYYCELVRPTLDSAQKYAEQLALARGTEVAKVQTYEEHLQEAMDSPPTQSSRLAPLPYDYLLRADGNVKQAQALLEQYGREYDKQQLQDVVKAADELSEGVKQLDNTATELLKQLEAENKELKQKQAELEKQLSEMKQSGGLSKEDLTEILEQQRMTKRASRLIEESVTRLKARVEALKDGVQELKTGICQNCRQLVKDAKEKGSAALNQVKEIVDVRGKLEWLKNCIDNGVYEVQKTCQKVAECLDTKVVSKIEGREAKVEQFNEARFSIQQEEQILKSLGQGSFNNMSVNAVQRVDWTLKHQQNFNERCLQGLHSIHTMLTKISDRLGEAMDAMAKQNTKEARQQTKDADLEFER